MTLLTARQGGTGQASGRDLQRRLRVGRDGGFDPLRTDAELLLPPFSPADRGGHGEGSLADNRLDGLVDVKNPLDVTPMAGDAAYAT